MQKYLLVSFLLFGTAIAQQPGAISGYNKPPQNVLDILHTPASPRPKINPTRDALLLISWVEYPPISQVAEPYLKLAGTRVEPRTRRNHNTSGGYSISPCAHRISLIDIASGSETELPLPAQSCADGFTWSADGKRFAFRNTAENSVELWTGDVRSKSMHRLNGVRLNPMLGDSLQWMPDQQTLLVKLVPQNSGAAPKMATNSVGPSIQESDGKSGESSTYEKRDTLNNKQDEALFEYYATSQLAFVNTLSGKITAYGRPSMFTNIDPAPSGEHILVTSLKKPFSYVTTYSRFAQDVEIWNRRGEKHVLAKIPVADHVPIHGVRTGPRGFGWRPTEPATLIWVEALDNGDWNVKVPERDKLMMLRAPFTQPAIEFMRTEQRFAGFDWTERPQITLLRDYDHNKHWVRTSVVNVDDPKAPLNLLWSMSSEENYNYPGSPVYRILANGQWVAELDNDTIYLSDWGATPDGDRPFLDRFDLKTQKRERLFRSDKNVLEYFISFTDKTNQNFLTWHQSPKDPPNLMLRTLGDNFENPPTGEATVNSTVRAVTHIPDPTPAIRSIKKRIVKYKRKDGVELSFKIFTPPNYVEGSRLPAILSAYPIDFSDANTAGQIIGSEQTFTQIGDYKLLLLSGYVVIDAAFPIIGDPRKAYDTYLKQLVENARAAVDKAVELGIVDRHRVGVTGHSHGALMTVNLLAHTDLFQAGVATSGSYNKTLTPFGFQNERRSVWKAQDVYLKVSPFFFADKIKLPLLIVHGMDDANPGTTPLQSTLLYDAIRGNGGTARLVMLPFESHIYSAMESNEQLAYEELRWFDKYVKNR